MKSEKAAIHTAGMQQTSPAPSIWQEGLSERDAHWASRRYRTVLLSSHTQSTAQPQQGSKIRASDPAQT